MHHFPFAGIHLERWCRLLDLVELAFNYIGAGLNDEMKWFIDSYIPAGLSEAFAIFLQIHADIGHNFFRNVPDRNLSFNKGDLSLAGYYCMPVLKTHKRNTVLIK